MKVGLSDGAETVMVGYKVPSLRGQGFYALLEPAGAQWRVLRFGSALPERTSAEQEILFVAYDRTWVQPAYDYAVSDAYFGCSALAKGAPERAPGIPVYGPCSGSRFASVDLAATAGRNAFALPLTLGLAAGTNRSVDVAAVQAALASTALVPQVERAMRARMRTDEALAQLGRAAADLGRRASASLAYEERIVDDSGFFRRGPEQFARMVRIQQPDLVGAYKEELARMPKTFDGVDAYAAAYDSLERRITADTEALPQSYALGLQCGAGRQGPFLVQLECPAQVAWSDLVRSPKVGLTVRILKAAPQVLAPSLAHGDDALELRADSRELQLRNRTAVYLEVREISCYADGEVSTRRWVAGGEHLTLPPQSQLKPALAQGELCRGDAERRLRLPAVRLEDVKGRNLRFGIAVKYRRAGEAVDRTLFQERQLPLDALVRGAL